MERTEEDYQITDEEFGIPRPEHKNKLEPNFVHKVGVFIKVLFGHDKEEEENFILTDATLGANVEDQFFKKFENEKNMLVLLPMFHNKITEIIWGGAHEFKISSNSNEKDRVLRRIINHTTILWIKFLYLFKKRRDAELEPLKSTIKESVRLEEKIKDIINNIPSEISQNKSDEYRSRINGIKSKIKILDKKIFTETSHVRVWISTLLSYWDWTQTCAREFDKMVV